MFVRILKESFIRQTGIKVLAVVALALGASVAAALLNLSLDVGDKMARELKQYGANIVVVPKERALSLETGGIHFNPLQGRSFIEDKYLMTLRQVFWSRNIKGVAPYLAAAGEVDHRKVKIVGTWFEKENTLPTGEVFVEGIKKIKPWLIVEGQWINDEHDYDAALINEEAQKTLPVKPGEWMTAVFYGTDGPREMRVLLKGVLKGDEARESKIYVPLRFLQDNLKLGGKVQEIEVSAVTTPDNALSGKVAEDPDSVTGEEFERWYCTAYVSSVAFQIEEAIPFASAQPIRKVAEAEGNILKKLKILMVLLTIFALTGAVLGVWSLMTTAVLERTKEIGLMKAMGADSWKLVNLFMAEVLLISVLAGLVGYGAGFFLCQLIARSVFGYGVPVKPAVLPLVFLLSAAAAMAGSFVPLKMILRLRPVEVLHDRQ